MIPDSEPSPLALLRDRTAEALTDLGELRSHDPAAARALRAIRLTRHTLEHFWLPAIDRLLHPPTRPDDIA